MDLKDLQIQMLSETIGQLYKQIAELQSALIVLQNEKKEAENGEHQDSSADK